MIVSNYVSSHLARSVNFFNNTQPASASPPIATLSSQPLEKVASAPVKGKGTFSKFWELWKPLNTISDGKKVDDMDDKKLSEAFEAKEENILIY